MWQGSNLHNSKATEAIIKMRKWNPGWGHVCPIKKLRGWGEDRVTVLFQRRNTLA
jgi:hypothetical protein